MNTLPKGGLKRIHMNKFWIGRGWKNAIRIKTGNGKNIRADRVEINGPSAVVYQPTQPLSCGAKAWVETRSQVMWEEK